MRRSIIPVFLTICLPASRSIRVDYLLLGQHYIRNEIDGVYVYEPTDDPKVLTSLCKPMYCRPWRPACIPIWPIRT